MENDLLFCSKLMFTKDLNKNQIIYLQTTIFPFVNINLEQNKRSFSICVTPDIKWTIPGSR
jgi:hypothetical protein